MFLLKPGEAPTRKNGVRACVCECVFGNVCIRLCVYEQHVCVCVCVSSQFYLSFVSFMCVCVCVRVYEHACVCERVRMLVCRCLTVGLGVSPSGTSGTRGFPVGPVGLGVSPSGTRCLSQWVRIRRASQRERERVCERKARTPGPGNQRGNVIAVESESKGQIVHFFLTARERARARDIETKEREGGRERAKAGK